MKTKAIARQELFFQNLNFTINSHLADPDFNVTKLLRVIGMSRTDLHRKITRTTGMSTTEYLRFCRLKKAAYLLQNYPDKCVYQVAIDVGFQDQGYFSKRFREVFGVCPTGYKNYSSNLEHLFYNLEQ